MLQHMQWGVNPQQSHLKHSDMVNLRFSGSLRVTNVSTNNWLLSHTRNRFMTQYDTQRPLLYSNFCSVHSVNRLVGGKEFICLDELLAVWWHVGWMVLSQNYNKSSCMWRHGDSWKKKNSWVVLDLLHLTQSLNTRRYKDKLLTCLDIHDIYIFTCILQHIWFSKSSLCVSKTKPYLHKFTYLNKCQLSNHNQNSRQHFNKKNIKASKYGSCVVLC